MVRVLRENRKSGRECGSAYPSIIILLSSFPDAKLLKICSRSKQNGVFNYGAGCHRAGAVQGVRGTKRACAEGVLLQVERALLQFFLTCRKRHAVKQQGTIITDCAATRYKAVLKEVKHCIHMCTPSDLLSVIIHFFFPHPCGVCGDFNITLNYSIIHYSTRQEYSWI